MRICLDLGSTETIDPHTVAAELLALGAKRDDELVTYWAGERTAFPTGRLAELAQAAVSKQDLTKEKMGIL